MRPQDTELASGERERARRNLNPHKSAVAAMWLYGHQYSQQGGGSMDFWKSLPPSQQDVCRMLVVAVEKARKE